MRLLWLLLTNVLLWLSPNCLVFGGGIVPGKTLGQVWPLPQQIVQKTTYLSLDSQTFQFVYQGIGCTIIDAAIARYQTLIFNPPRYASSIGYWSSMDPTNLVATLPRISITLSGGCETRPYFGMDESYVLKVDSVDLPGAAQLTANSTWGILRGLESFSQLVYHDDARNFYANSTDILDFPRFPYRSYLPELGRHYVSVATIKQHLDAMAYNKFNVLHFRPTDDESFPYQSQQFPNMSLYGAYNPKTHIYTFDDITSIINYASDRGIQVIPEFDTPAHALSWGLSMPQLLTTCYSAGLPSGNGPIDPTKNSTYDFLTEFYTEAARLFTDDYFVMGGDEVDFSCWASNPNVNQFMQQMGFGSDYSLLYQYYFSRLLPIMSTIPNPKKSIVWQDVFDYGAQLNSDSLVIAYLDPTEMSAVTSQGYKTIFGTCWFLDDITWGSDWTKFYSCEPLNFTGTQAQYDLVIGGTAFMWGQYVDATNSISRTWPRGSAVGERLWSSRDVSDADAATPRLEEHRCRMLERNINAEPPSGPNYCQADYLVT